MYLIVLNTNERKLWGKPLKHLMATLSFATTTTVTTTSINTADTLHTNNTSNNNKWRHVPSVPSTHTVVFFLPHTHCPAAPNTHWKDFLSSLSSPFFFFKIKLYVYEQIIQTTSSVGTNLPQTGSCQKVRQNNTLLVLVFSFDLLTRRKLKNSASLIAKDFMNY